jgi:hypothetical protein
LAADNLAYIVGYMEAYPFATFDGDTPFHSSFGETVSCHEEYIQCSFMANVIA